MNNCRADLASIINVVWVPRATLRYKPPHTMPWFEKRSWWQRLLRRKRLMYVAISHSTRFDPYYECYRQMNDGLWAEGLCDPTSMYEYGRRETVLFAPSLSREELKVDVMKVIAESQP